MMENPIPPELQEFRFILVEPHGKRAIEKNWQTTANYAYGDPRLTEHIQHGGNYGVLPGEDHIFIETDTAELERLVEQNFPPTLTQRSPGHGTKHFLYRGRLSKTWPLLDKSKPKDKRNIGHAKWGGNYVLGAGSTHPNGGKYELVDRLAMAALTEERVKQVLGSFMVNKARLLEQKEAAKYDPVTEFSIRDLLPQIPGLKGMGGGQLQGPHPVHGSTGGTNFSVNPCENVWHCFRCDSGGGPYQLFAVLEGIIDCEDAVPGGLRGELFKQTRTLALERGLIKRTAARLANGDGEKPELTEQAEPHEVSEAILANFRIVTLQDDDTVLVYDGGKYHDWGEGLIGQIVESQFHKAELDQVSNNHFVSEVVGHVKRRTGKPRDVFDKDPFILNLKNGLLNVDTGEFKPHSPDYYSTVQLPVEYNPQADRSQVEVFVSQILDAGDIPTVQEETGSCLLKQPVKKAFMWIGEGDNAKSTLLNLLTALLGPENVSARSLQELENNRFAKADLYGKLANLYADLPDTALKTTGTFKILTGGDPITAEHKFGQPFTYVPYAKQFYSCNRIPEAPDDTPAFFARWEITRFSNSFPEGDPRRNTNILKELTIPENLSAFLNWALEGLKRLRKNAFRFTTGKTTDATRAEYRRRSNPVYAFIEEYCNVGPNLEARKDQLYRAYVQFCGENHFTVLQQPSFYQRLVGKFETTTHLIDGKRPAFLVGLNLRTSQEREAWRQSEQTLPTEGDT